MNELPDEVMDLLYYSQREEISRYLREEVITVMMNPKDPVWNLLDDLLTGSNRVKDLSRSGVACTVHELVPNRYAVWIMGDDDIISDMSDQDRLTAILINSSDLKSIVEEGGIFGLQLRELFRDFN